MHDIALTKNVISMRKLNCINQTADYLFLLLVGLADACYICVHHTLTPSHDHV